MRRRFRSLIILILGALAAAAGSAPAQTPAYRAQRTADGNPDLNGIWQALNEAHWNLEGHAAAPSVLPQFGAQFSTPPGLGVVEGGPIPYLASALEQRKQNFLGRLQLDPEAKCYLPGVPRAVYMPHPFQIIQSSNTIMIAYGYAGAVRVINMGKATEAPIDSWMGWSNGRWEGETLVVDVTGFNDQTWFDRAGNFHSDALHVVERYTARSPDTLMYEATIEDPKVFSRPWQITMPLYRRVEKNAQLLEFKCPEFAEELIYGSLRKQPGR